MASKLSILLVEDSYTQALNVQLMLQREGYHVSIATNGADGWKKACDEMPDLILLDINLPILDGFQVLTRLKLGRSTRNIPVVMLARSDYRGTVERAMALGASEYLCKDDCIDRHDGTVSLFQAITKFVQQPRVIHAEYPIILDSMCS